MIKVPKPNREHQRLKLIITVGVVTTSTLATVAPSYTAHITILGVVVNLIWIWF